MTLEICIYEYVGAEPKQEIIHEVVESPFKEVFPVPSYFWVTTSANAPSSFLKVNYVLTSSLG